MTGRRVVVLLGGPHDLEVLEVLDPLRAYLELLDDRVDFAYPVRYRLAWGRVDADGLPMHHLGQPVWPFYALDELDDAGVAELYNRGRSAPVDGQRSAAAGLAEHLARQRTTRRPPAYTRRPPAYTRRPYRPPPQE